MQLKASKYNLLVSREQENFLLNTYSGSAVSLKDNEFIKLKEILNNIDRFQKTDFNNKLIEGFLLKHGFVVPYHKDEVHLVMKDYNNRRKDSSKLSLLITPTLKCNMKCFYCYQDRENKSNLNVKDDIDAIVNFAKNKLETSGKLHVSWFGGEPLYDKNFVYNASTALMELANLRNAEYSASMVSNGYLLDDLTITELKKYKVKSIQITLDGSQVQHDKVRRHLNPISNKREGSFSTIIKNVKKAATFFNISLRVNVSQINMNSIYNLINELALEGLANKEINLYFHPVFNYHITKPNSDYSPAENVHLTIQNFSKLESEWLLYAKEKGFNINDPFKPEDSGCIAVQKNGYVIQSNGEVKKCSNDIGKSGTAFTSISSLDTVDTCNLDMWDNYQPDAINECKKCVFLPVCHSNCPHRNMYSPEEKPDKCPSFKYNWETTLPLYLKQRLGV
ncbi:radical SAM/SPASM domain-containing protein [Bacillus mycoides]|uniref:Radical SAM protein n=1 Tax=Bacillus mycoides TaxID=1405 RepID=A0A4U2ZY64_BACMY|nr:radical SAM protein [Bacillus mycoides]TKI79835.1 radical SAM protein [Bacillus mycoides]